MNINPMTKLQKMTFDLDVAKGELEELRTDLLLIRAENKKLKDFCLAFACSCAGVRGLSGSTVAGNSPFKPTPIIITQRIIRLIICTPQQLHRQNLSEYPWLHAQSKKTLLRAFL